MWLISALISGSLYTISGLLTRHILKGNNDSWAFSFYFSAIGALISLPFALGSSTLPSSTLPWFLMLIVGFMIMAQNYLNFRSSNHLPASVNGIISKFRLVWVFLLGLAFSLEIYSDNKLFGMLLTVSASILLLSKARQSGDKEGMLYAFSATFLYAIVIILYQYLFNYFDPTSLTFFIFLFPALINLILMPNRKKRIAGLYLKFKAPLIIACISGGLANLAMNFSLQQGNSTSTLVIIEAFLIITLIFEGIFLKEKGNLIKKIIATILAVAGAVIIRLA